MVRTDIPIFCSAPAIWTGVFFIEMLFITANLVNVEDYKTAQGACLTEAKQRHNKCMKGVA
jgi:hypothetical protein